MATLKKQIDKRRNKLLKKISKFAADIVLPEILDIKRMVLSRNISEYAIRFDELDLIDIQANALSLSLQESIARRREHLEHAIYDLKEIIKIETDIDKQIELLHPLKETKLRLTELKRVF
jgi:hypothetical protein